MTGEELLVRVGGLSKALAGKKVGFVRVSAPQKYRAQYEVAAWYTDYESDVGDFDLILHHNHIYREQLYVEATIPATTVGNNHTPLFGGVPIGKSADRRGERGTIPVKSGWAEAAAGKSDKSGLEFVISLDHLGAAVEYAENNFRHNAGLFAGYHGKYLAEPRNQFNSNMGMVSAVGGWVENWGRLLEEMLRRQASRTGWLNQYEKVQVG